MSATPFAGRSNEDWIERVRAASDIVEVISQTVALKRVGRNFVGLCPFHAEKTPSFSVHPERQFYHCFSCKVGGDVFRFVEETEKLAFLDAVAVLSRRAGIPVPERGAAGGGVRGPVLEALAAAAECYEQWLADARSGARARDYLERRGLDRETQRWFRLGLAPEGWEHQVRRLRGKFPDEVLVQAGLAGRRDGGRGGVFDRFRNRLMIPLIQAGGDVVGFGARALAAGDEPKYLNSPETAVYHKGSFLFALEQARRHIEPAGEAIVVEGYFDAIALHQAGLRNAVATSGTALTADHARILRRMTDRVALTYDGDAAGQDAVARSLGVLLADGFHVVVVDLPPGEDPDSLVRRHGATGWAEHRRAAADPIEFLQRHVLREDGAADPREAAVQEVVRLVSRIPDPVRVRLLLERASEVFGLATDVLVRAVALRRTGQVSEQPVAAAVRARQSNERGIEARFLRGLVQDPNALAEVRDQVDPADFRDRKCAQIARWIWDGGAGFPDDEELAAQVREWSLEQPGPFDWREEVRGAARKLVIRRLREHRARAQEALRRADSADEQSVLLREVSDLARAIDDLERSSRMGTVQ